MAKAKAKATNLPVPQSRDEAAAAVADIGALQRQKARLETDMNAELAAVRTRYETEAAPINSDIEKKTGGIAIWASANRAELTKDGKTKTVDLGTGELQWRHRPPSVRISGVEAVIESLKAGALKRFLRTKTEIDKEAMLKEPDAAGEIEGVSIGSAGEDFVVVPFAAELGGSQGGKP